MLKADYIEELFARMGVLTPVELESRFDVYAEQYLLAIEVEAKLVVSMAKTIIYPAAVRYLSELSLAIANAAAIGIEMDKERAQTVSNLIKLLMDGVSKLSEATAKDDFDSIEEHMQHSAQTIRNWFGEIISYFERRTTNGVVEGINNKSSKVSFGISSISGEEASGSIDFCSLL